MTRRSVRARLRSAAGFTIIELMITSIIMMAVTGAIFTLLNPAQGTFQAQPEVSDMQQRLRVGVDAISKDLIMAGAGTYSGASGTTGALVNFFPPILPYRAGNLNPDPPGSFKTDTISITYVPPTSSQTTISDPMPQPSAEIKVKAQPGCPVTQGQPDQLCGFKEGMRALIFDDTGAYDSFNITNVQGAASPPHFQHRLDTFSKSYGSGARIAQVATHTYYFKADSTAGTYQLMHYDGDETDLPVVDNVVALQFEYYGEPAAPVLVTDTDGTTRTTYGPKPPALGVSGGNGYANGENCAFMIDPVSGQQVPRLATLGPTQALVHLTATELTDGPWCPSAAAATRYDADLLRIRSVKVKLRVQVGLASLRGPAGVLFSHAGTSTGGNRWVPDQEIRFDISPRNLNLGR